MTHEFGLNNTSPAEQAFVAAKDSFRETMMGCEPFADLVMAHISDPRRQMPTELPDFNCEPWRFTDHTGKPDGYGVRLSFSRTRQDGVLCWRFNESDYIKVARVTTNKELFMGVLVNAIEDRQPDVSNAEERARSIVNSYLSAYNDFVGAEIPGDQLAVDGMGGVFGLASDIDDRNCPIE